MADLETARGERRMDDSSVIDMQAEDDASDYEVNFNDSETSRRRDRHEEGQEGFADGIKKTMAENVTSYIWQSGTQQAKKAFSLYGNIDILRPYFDVEPHQVRKRLIMSLVPSRPGSAQQVKVHRELYGPLMLVFTMIALLLYQMKTSGHSVEEGTLMGSAFAVCFGYWLGACSLMWFLGYVCNTHISLLQLLSMVGYALFGHCIVLGLTTLIHTTHDHMFFYLAWLLFGGLSTLKMVSILMSRTAGQTQKLIVCAAVAFLHLFFLLYLHFAYHQIVEDLSDMLDRHPGQFVPANGLPSVTAQQQQQHKVFERSVTQITEKLDKRHEAVAPGKQQIQKGTQPKLATKSPFVSSAARLTEHNLPPGNASLDSAKKPQIKPSTPLKPAPKLTHNKILEPHKVHSNGTAT